MRALQYLGYGAALPALAIASDAAAKSRYVQPYIELTQVATADLNTDDVLTYTQLAAGIDASVAGPRAEAQISYRYERRFAWEDDVNDNDVHSGLARGSYRLTPALTLDAGALATRTRFDIRGAAPGVLAGNVDNVTQVYSVYGGPSLNTTAGPIQLGASYQAAYTKAESPQSIGLAPGEPSIDYFDESSSHIVTATAGIAAGTVLPFGITLSGAYDREDASQLDQAYEGWYGRGDVVLPITRTVALRGGVGYERIESTQRDPLVDADGNAVTDGNGRYVTDPASPVRIAYRTDGLIYDAGVIWRPSSRLELQANAGWRYGGETYTGLLSYQVDKSTGLRVSVYDGIETFGRQLRDGLRQMPTQFSNQPDPFGQQFSGCVFGSRPGEGGSGAGGCLNDAFQSASASSYRARGVDAVLSTAMGRSSYGIGLGYSSRKLYAPRNAPGINVFGSADESYYAQAFWSRALTRRSMLDLNVYTNYWDSGLSAGDGVVSVGGTGSYSLNFGRLGTIASLGVYTYDQEGLETQWSAQALLGARYSF
jgi:hypothetical protein